mgnify:CR=1 FL=1
MSKFKKKYAKVFEELELMLDAEYERGFNDAMKRATKMLKDTFKIPKEESDAPR